MTLTLPQELHSCVWHTFSLCSICLWSYVKFASVVLLVIIQTWFWPLTWLRPWPWTLEPKSCAQHTFSLCFIYIWSFIKFASVVYEQHNLRLNLPSDMTMTLTLGVGTNDCVRHTFSICSIFLWSFVKFASVDFELLLRHDFDLWPDCDLDLGRRNLNHVRDTPSHYALSSYEV